MAMNTIFSSVRSVKQRIARRRQMRTALHMLSASGVLRPSHIELRYTAPLNRKWLAHQQPIHLHEAMYQPSTVAFLWPEQVKLGLTRMKHWVGNICPTQLQTGE